MSTNEREVQTVVSDEEQKATFVDHFVALTDAVQQLDSEHIVRPIVVAGHQAFLQDEDHLSAFFETGALAAETERNHSSPRPERIADAMASYLKEHGPRKSRLHSVANRISSVLFRR